MSIPVHITCRHLTAHPELEAAILTHVGHLERFFDRIVDCRVLIEQLHRRHTGGNAFRVVIELTVPQDRLVIAHDVSTHGLSEALHDAFRAAGRRLQDYAGQRRDAARS